VKNVEIKPEDFGYWDWDEVYLAGAALLGEVADIAYHSTNPSEGWGPLTRRDDVPALIKEVRDHADRLDEALGKARKLIADVERNARLAAMRRIRAEKKAEETN
jgi:hypothetical protein